MIAVQNWKQLEKWTFFLKCKQKKLSEMNNNESKNKSNKAYEINHHT